MSPDLICLILSYEKSSELTIDRLSGAKHDIKILKDYAKNKNKSIYIYTDVGDNTSNITWKLFIDDLEKFKSDKVIFYYSGHFLDNNIILPNDKNIPFVFLMEKFNEKFKKCFMILDCCFCSTICLRYLSIGNGLARDINCNIGDKDENMTNKNKIVVLYSLNKEGYVYSSSKRGSLFTEKIFEIIINTKQKILFNDITTKIFENDTKAIIYSSHPKINYLWKWINI